MLNPMLPFAGPESAYVSAPPENDHASLHPNLLGQAGPLLKSDQRSDYQTGPEKKKGQMGNSVSPPDPRQRSRHRRGAPARASRRPTPLPAMKLRLLHTPLTSDIFSRQRFAKNRMREKQRRRYRRQMRGTHSNWRGPPQITKWRKRRSRDG